MSSITYMVIFMGLYESEAMTRLNAWCAQNDPGVQQFEPLDTDAAGGRKVFTASVWAMAGNYFDWERLAEALPTFGWNWPNEVVLIVDDEHGNAVQVFRASQAGEVLGYEYCNPATGERLLLDPREVNVVRHG